MHNTYGGDSGKKVKFESSTIFNKWVLKNLASSEALPFKQILKLICEGSLFKTKVMAYTTAKTPQVDADF